MNIELVPLPIPATASPLVKFGREVKGVHPGNLGPEQFRLVEEALYKVGIMESFYAIEKAQKTSMISCYFATSI